MSQLNAPATNRNRSLGESSKPDKGEMALLGKSLEPQ
jgi:hypothetical protein